MASSMTRWAPFADLSELRTRLDRVFDDVTNGEGGWIPRVDVVREEGGLKVRADVPGVKPEEIDVTVENGILTISGQHEETSEKKHDDFLRRERRYGSFSRSLTLPEGVDPERIEADCKDGVLELGIPLPEPAEPRKVQIKPSSG